MKVDEKGEGSKVSGICLRSGKKTSQKSKSIEKGKDKTEKPKNKLKRDRKRLPRNWVKVWETKKQNTPKISKVEISIRRSKRFEQKSETLKSQKEKVSPKKTKWIQNGYSEGEKLKITQKKVQVLIDMKKYHIEKNMKLQSQSSIEDVLEWEDKNKEEKDVEMQSDEEDNLTPVKNIKDNSVKIVPSPVLEKKLDILQTVQGKLTELVNKGNVETMKPLLDKADQCVILKTTPNILSKSPRDLSNILSKPNPLK